MYFIIIQIILYHISYIIGCNRCQRRKAGLKCTDFCSCNDAEDDVICDDDADDDDQESSDVDHVDDDHDDGDGEKEQVEDEGDE